MVSLWEKVSRLEYEIILTSNNITEIVFVFKNIHSVEQNKSNYKRSFNQSVPAYCPELILQLWDRNIKDYDDAVLAAANQLLEA
ncbi:hypothetical protein FH581_015535 [Leptospira weilii]|uniref:hypothetical protein n=1 Tax=Leptospira weilii TaxID=28184 RepID=UPI001EF2AE84|nr:hypothetical protein [Leptospira weilii]ULH28699.1 hypothetical protein FH586_20840 [Leptospira weilii]UPY79618.1 hypothetical protein FH581_015535 [Leptospira weilii]